MNNAEVTWQSCLNDAQSTLDQFMSDKSLIAKCIKFSDKLIETFESGNKLMTCGNGGSHCDAMHFSEELTGRYRKDRKPLGSIALGDASHTTCVTNDYGFEHIFSRQVEALGKKGDLLVGLSTSGNSKNVINAFEIAKKQSIFTVGLTGKDGGQLSKISDLSIIVPAETSDRIQEMHIKIIHISIEVLERKLFPENYK